MRLPLNAAAARLLALAAATGLVYVLSLAVSALACVAVVASLVVVAFPIWVDGWHRSVFERRAILAGTALEGSPLRALLWKGRIAAALLPAGALLWALVLLAFAHLLGRDKWLVVAVAVVLVASLAGPMRRWLSAHVVPSRIGDVVRHWPLRWLAVAALTLGFMAVDLFVGATDTRAHAWRDVADRAFATHDGAACDVVGWLVGMLAAVDALAWHARQSLIPELATTGARVVAWIVVLLQAGVLSLALTRLQIGVLALVDHAAARPRRPSDRAIPFTTGLVSFAALAAVAAFVLGSADTGTLRNAGRQAVLLADPCSAPRAVATFNASLGAELATAREAAVAAAMRDVDVALDEIYADVERGIDAYLDEYFRVVTDYKLIAAGLFGDGAVDYLRRKLQAHLFENTRFAARVEAGAAAITARSVDRLGDALGSVRAQIVEQARSGPCAYRRIDVARLSGVETRLGRVAFTAAGSVAVGLVAGRAVASATATIAGSTAFRASAGVVGKVVRKRLPGGSVALVCPATGAFAVACAAAAAVLAWVAGDIVGSYVEEALYRDKLEQEILSLVQGHKAELAALLKARHIAEIDAVATTIRRSVDGAFVPARDGI